MKSREEAESFERMINKAVGMFDLPDGSLWANAQEVNGDWAVVVDFEPFEEDS